MVDVVIVGAGPAGLSAAVYTARAGFSTMVIGGVPGGLLTTTEQVDNYLGLPGTSGADMAELFVNHAKQFGAEMVYENISKIVKNDHGFTVEIEDGSSVPARSVIFAAGSDPRKLGVKNEHVSGVSYCATCDGMFFEGDDVAVIGGGETAVEDSLYLSQIAASVHVFVRSQWRATAPAVAKLEAKDNVTIHLGENVAEIVEDSGSVSGVVTSDGGTLRVDGVFVAAGQCPNSKTAEGFVTLYEDGFIEQSTVDGFFVAGDIRNSEYRQVAVAVGDGATAGIAATRYLLNK